MRLVVAIVVMSSLASAQPPDEYAVRAGASWVSTKGDYGLAPKGRGPSVDGEVTWRYPYVSLSLFGSYLTFRDETDENDQTIDIRRDARFHMLDAGGRLTVHGRGPGPFWGVGIAGEVTIESGTATRCYCENNYCNPCMPDYTNRPYTQWNLGPLFEAHVGAQLPKTGPVAIEVMLLFGYGLNPDDTSSKLSTTRLSAGARF